MKITSIRIRMLNNTGNKMVGLVSITLENMIAIHDIKILKAQNELFLAMPSRPTKNGTFKDMVHPINATIREALEKIVLGGYAFCESKNTSNAQFDVRENFIGVLTDQTIDDFLMTSYTDRGDYGVTDQYHNTPTKEHKTETNSVIGNDISKWLEG